MAQVYTLHFYFFCSTAICMDTELIKTLLVTEAKKTELALKIGGFAVEDIMGCC